MATLMDLSQESTRYQREFAYEQRKAREKREASEQYSRHSAESLHNDGSEDADSTDSIKSYEPKLFLDSGHDVAKRQAAIVNRPDKAIERFMKSFLRTLESLHSSDYVENASVAVENPLKGEGHRFRHVSAEITEYHPGRVKLDTASKANFVSLDYLLQAGFDQSALKPIPTDQQAEVEGLNGARYTPKHEINLKWHREGESLTNVGRFLVVEQAPFDILLASNRFAEEVVRRLVSLPLYRAKKSRGKCRSILLHQGGPGREVVDL